MVVQFEDEADQKYREAGRWYGARVAGLGLDSFDEVDATLRRIVAFPKTGVPVPRVPKDLAVRRVAVKRFPYFVIYLERADAIRVLAIAHDRRRPDGPAKILMAGIFSTRRPSAALSRVTRERHGYVPGRGA